LEVDDLALVDAARAGDTDAFTALVVRYQRKVYAVALGIVKDPDQAWDVSQEAFVRVHGHLAEFKGESSFQTWVLRIASHLAIDSLRRERKNRRDQLEDVAEELISEAGEGILSTPLGNDPVANLLRRELGERMEAALDRLPEIHRTILVLREVEGLSYEELAERLGVQKGTVMSRLFHARQNLQALLLPYVKQGEQPAASLRLAVHGA
jgi:RNA polymerase sigma-70 factor (ECF subfamily)